MSIILALDTSTEACSAALFVNGDIYTEYAVCPREHNQRILKMVDAVLTQAGLTLENVDAIAYGAGPGSFTGVRITTGIVQGLAFAADKPVVSVSSLAAMAHSLYRVHGATDVIAAIDARMNEIYLGVYQITGMGNVVAVQGEAVCAPQGALADLSADNTWHAIGTGWQTYQAELTEQVNANIEPELQFPQAYDVALIAVEKLASGETLTAEAVCPTYLRNEVAWKKMPGRN